MIKTIRVKDNNIIDYLGDNTDSITELTNNSTCAPGSTCYLIETGETYIKKLTGEWTAKLETKYGKIPSTFNLTLDISNSGPETNITGDFDTIAIAENSNDKYKEVVNIPMGKDIVWNGTNSFLTRGLTITVDEKKVFDEPRLTERVETMTLLTNDLITQYNIAENSNVVIKAYGSVLSE
jgi:hypothetical protein